MQKINLNREQLDALKEIGTIGGGSAATALSQLLCRKVYIKVPHVEILCLEELTGREFSVNPEDLGFAVTLKILGSLKGEMLVLFSHKNALLMVDILNQRKIGTTGIINLIEASALSESSHILCSAYLNAIGELLNLHQLIPLIPKTVVDKMDRLNKVLLSKFMEEDIKYVLPIENHLVMEDVELDVLVVFVLEYESVSKILKIVGL